MQNSASNSPFRALCSNHNIASVNYTKIQPSVPVRPFLIHGGNPAFLGAIGSLPSVTSTALRIGRGGAYSASMDAAISSDRASIISLMSCMSRLRALAMRFMRPSLNSARRPWWHATRYSTILRSRSSAVAGGRIGIPLVGQSVSITAISLFASNFIVAGTTR